MFNIFLHNLSLRSVLERKRVRYFFFKRRHMGRGERGTVFRWY
jgi:hypothetical protein